MEEVYHCPAYLMSHPLAKTYGSTLYDLAEKDYPGRHYFRGCEIPAIDLDSYEKALHRPQEDCTSDAVVGIATLSGVSLRKKRLLLTEFRMDYKNVENLDFSNIKQKYTHSYEILRQYNYEIQIDERFALIFFKDKVSKAYSWIRRTARGATKKEAANWDAYSPESFCNYINYGRDIPLSPTEETKEKVCKWCSNDNMSFDELVIICEEISNYWWKIKGNRLIVDQEYIVQNIKPFLSALIFPKGEEGEMCDFAKTELLSLLES